jgi:hypothetical protein
VQCVPITWELFDDEKKTRGRKSRVRVPLKQADNFSCIYREEDKERMEMLYQVLFLLFLFIFLLFFILDISLFFHQNSFVAKTTTSYSK